MQLLETQPFTFGETAVVMFNTSQRPGDADLDKQQQQKFEVAVWTAIEVCNKDHWYIPDTINEATLITGHVTHMIMHIHPRHVYITYSALKSAPLNSRQAFHPDYAVQCAAHEKPFSVIVIHASPAHIPINSCHILVGKKKRHDKKINICIYYTAFPSFFV